MSPEAYSFEIVEAAEELYIIDGLTFAQVAGRTGVSVAQLKRWSADSQPTWPDRRREYRQAQVSVRRGVMLAKARLIESVIESEDPQKAFAFNSLVAAGRAIDEEARERNQAAAKDQLPEVSGDGPVNIIEGLNQALNNKIARLLSSPGAITLTSIKELQQAMGLLDKLKAKMAEANVDGKTKGASAATIDQLRAAIMKELSV